MFFFFLKAEEKVLKKVRRKIKNKVNCDVGCYGEVGGGHINI